MKKSFRGKLTDGDVQQIRLGTNNGLTGYQIIKFELIGPNANSMIESVVKVFSTKTDETNATRTANTDISFNDPTLLAAATIANTNSNVYNPASIVVFDNMVFNQDIFITLKGHDHLTDVNYYLELEQVKLSDNEATVATLKDMRAGPDTNFGS